jgi:hypothetical protein
MAWWPLTREEALELARRHVEGQGLTFSEPVRVSRRPFGGWSIWTNADRMGGNVRLTISRHGRIRGGDRVTPR